MSGVQGAPLGQAQLAELILNSAVNFAAARGYRLGDGASSDFASAAGTAAQDILNEPIGDQPAKLAEAVANFEKMIGEMIAAAPSIPGYVAQHPNEIGEQTLTAAKFKLCPIWPFCR